MNENLREIHGREKNPAIMAAEKLGALSLEDDTAPTPVSTGLLYDERMCSHRPHNEVPPPTFPWHHLSLVSCTHAFGCA
jgi:hypothetical protein